MPGQKRDSFVLSTVLCNPLPAACKREIRMLPRLPNLSNPTSDPWGLMHQEPIPSQKAHWWETTRFLIYEQLN
jgi:hypothetical protein